MGTDAAAASPRVPFLRLLAAGLSLRPQERESEMMMDSLTRADLATAQSAGRGVLCPDGSVRFSSGAVDGGQLHGPHYVPVYCDVTVDPVGAGIPFRLRFVESWGAIWWVYFYLLGGVGMVLGGTTTSSTAGRDVLVGLGAVMIVLGALSVLTRRRLFMGMSWRMQADLEHVVATILVADGRGGGKVYPPPQSPDR